MMYGFGFIFMILFWGLLILGVMALFNSFNKSGTSTDASEAIRILRTRFAKGEISAKEYQERKKVLQS